MKFMCIFSLLLQCMLCHGYIGNELTDSVIIKIPKNPRARLGVSGNYKGIALRSVLSKVIDLWVLERCRDQLNSSDSQYAFKANILPYTVQQW